MSELSRRMFLQTTGVGALATSLIDAGESATASHALEQAQVAPKPTPELMDGMQSSFADPNRYPLDGRGRPMRWRSSVRSIRDWPCTI
jgi:hypothetical protein